MIRFLQGEIPDFTYDQAKVVVLPLGYERSTSYVKGTAKAPEAVLAASPYLETYDEELDAEPFLVGIYTHPEPDLENEPKHDFPLITETIARLLRDDKFVLTIGGEHSITFPVVRAFKKKFDRLSVVQFDAHADLRHSYEGSIYSHASVMHRVLEITDDFLQIGIRSLSKEEAHLIRQKQLRTVFAHQMYNGWPFGMIDTLQENVYITFDVDFFDPALVPATGTPEPGGFFWPETIKFLKELFAKKRVVGADVVELSPQPGMHAADFTVARLLYKMMGYKFCQK